MSDSMFIFIAIAIALIVITIIIFRKLKLIKCGSLCMVTGGVKTGKSTLSVYLAIKNHKKRVFKVKLYNYVMRCIGKKEKIRDLPLLYSNVPLNYPYSPLTDDLLLQRTRFVYGSVIYCCESSLVADSQLIKDKAINTQLLLFNKLIGHETKGGLLIYDTQCISDVHYSIKRSLSNYFYIHHLRKGLFFLCAYVLEQRYSDDGSVVSVDTKDIESDEVLQKVYISKKYWKYFDCYCYSSLTDDLPVSAEVIKKPSTLKAYNILSFRPEIRQKFQKKENNIND